MMLRNTCILLALLVWFAAVIACALAKQWAIVVPLLALAGLIETVTHHAQME